MYYTEGQKRVFEKYSKPKKKIEIIDDNPNVRILFRTKKDKEKLKRQRQFKHEILIIRKFGVFCRNFLDASPIYCKSCNSSNTKKDGYRHNVSGKNQRFKCLDCNYVFVLEDKRHFMKYTREMIKEALILRERENKSYRKIAEHITSKYKLKISHSTIMRWEEVYKIK